MKKLGKTAVMLLLSFAIILPVSAREQTFLVPVGQVVGLEIGDDSVMVAAFDDTAGQEAKSAGLQVGDEIVKINGKAIDSAEDVLQALETSDGMVEITLARSGTYQVLRMQPRITRDGPRLGVYLRQGITGIGTVTFYDPQTGNFGTLGHGVNNGKGELLGLTKGRAYSASVLSVKKGKAGEPGQLRGAVKGEEALGTLAANTVQGVFGHADVPWQGEVIPVAPAEAVHTGSAVIRSTVTGDAVQEYSVEILKVYPSNRANGRNLLLKVTDPELLELTGGIVQGMSGSPIIQDGKLVGAVTHVLVNDPTTGYGIFIENMLEAAA